MLGETLDPLFESALSAILRHDWSGAREVLAQRLDETGSLGRRRLNLYLLSVVASAAGHHETGDKLAQLARSTPLELSEPRYLGSSDDELHRQLELGWWAFNGWNVELSTVSSTTEETEGELPWADILDAVVEGRAGELERRWSSVLEGDRPERAALWNLVALAYLEKGDLRTYEEMREQSPSPTAGSPPLVALLESAGLQLAARALSQGDWVTSEMLHVDEAVLEDGLEAGSDPKPTLPAPVEALDYDEEAYWQHFGTAIERLKTAEHREAQLSLRQLLSIPLPAADPTPAFLLALAFAGSAILAGDTLEAQEAIDDAVRHAESAPLRAETLARAGEIFHAVGAATLATKLNLDELSTLDPWRDFPADFA